MEELTNLIVAGISKKGHLEWVKFMHHLKENTAQTLTESVSKLYAHTASEPSIWVNSMNKHFWAQNIKTYHKNDFKKFHLHPEQ